jgi:hypothetical protein
MTQEITLTLDRNLIHKAEKFAVKQSISVQKMLSDVLVRVIIQLDSERWMTCWLVLSEKRYCPISSRLNGWRG